MDPDNKFFNVLGKLGDFFILNIIYLISCIPIVTIGAATTALYYTTLKMAENRESYIVKDFKKSFKQNFKQATIIWLVMLAVIAVLAADSLLIGGMGQAIGSVVSIVVIVLTIFLVMAGVYVFPTLARFENTSINIIKNALIMAIRHLPSTIIIVALHAVPLSLAFVSIETFVKGFGIVLLFTVSILAYGQSKLFSRVFSNYYPKTAEYDFGNYNRGGRRTWLSRQK